MTDAPIIPPPRTQTAPFTDLVDLAGERVGGAALVASDEFFAPKENLLRPGRAVWDADRYTDRGKWMDGWESRRKRVFGHDWCILRLGVPGVVRGVDVDTSYFRGNFPEHASLEGCALEGDPAADEVEKAAEGCWVELLPRTALEGHGQNLLAVVTPIHCTHLRLNIYPDGGVARLRAYGEARPDWRRLARSGSRVDLGAVENGGAVIACNDMFFGSRHNLVMPGRSVNMGDGWETQRKRRIWGPAGEALSTPDWVIVRLGAAGTIGRIEVDTNWFKGNFPESCAIEGCAAADDAAALAGDRTWFAVLGRTKLRAHTRHFYEDEIAPHPTCTHVRLSIFPDGGVSRLRLWGTPTSEAVAGAALALLDGLPAARAEAELLRCCGSRAWAARMAERRPFASPETLFAAGEAIAATLAKDDWLEAFRAHPRIGSRKDVAGKAGDERRWAAGEQAGAAAAPAAVLAELAAADDAYFERFGHIFIVCATGKGADEMLALCRARLGHDPAAEIEVAAEEQRKITRIRLEKLLA